jgi:hypothetical protein
MELPAPHSFSTWSFRVRVRIVTAICVSSMLAVGQLPIDAAGRAQDPAPQQPARPPAGCRVTGRALAGATPLPGVAIVVRVGDAVKAATSTDLEGKYTILFGPNSTYHVSAELMAFGKMERDLTLGAPPCDTTVDFDLALRPRGEALPNAAASAPSPTTTPAAPAANAAAPGQPAAATPATGANPAPSAGQAAGQRFERLNVQADEGGQAAADTSQTDTSTDLARLLPPGFSAQSAQADAVAINGSSDAVNIDRGAMNDRFNAIGRGEFDPTTGQFAAGLGPAGGGAAGGDNPFGGGAGQAGAGGGGRGGGGGPGGGRGGFGGGPGGFTLGGRGGRGQSLYQGTATYQFGGSALDSTNLTTRDGEIVPVASLPFNRNNFGGTIGGPLKIPGIYEDTNRRTNFQANYTGNHSTQLQNQYATVPTAAMRNGDFTGSTAQLIDPTTGLPFAGNQIPGYRMDPTALSLLQYIPLPNVPGAGLTQNFNNSATTLSTSNALSLRITQNLTPNLPQRGAGAGRGGAGGGRGGGGGGGGRGGPGGRGGRGLSITLNGQLQYRENSGETFNVIPDLGGTTKSTTIAAPISLNISKGRTSHNITFQYNRARSSSSNDFSNVTDAAGIAGINYPSGASSDPLNWGVPNLTFTNFNLRMGAAQVRTDDRVSLGYAYSRPVRNNKHQLRLGADFRHDLSTSEINSNARGAYTFSGLYTTQGAQTSLNTGADFADFLLGLPQQATLQVGGTTKLKETAWDVYAEDNWQQSSHLTLSMSLRYEVALPYVETTGAMANLDVTPDFTAASVVTPGQTGPYTGAFPSGLVNTDWNNIAPRLGFAYRLKPNTILRGGYSITYNNTLAGLARQLVAQPPYASTVTNVGTLDDPLTIASGLVSSQETTTNNYGVDKNYSLGTVQIWNLTFSRDLTRNVTMIVGYTGTKGTNLDLLRAPNRNPDGTLRIPDVQAFTWESSGGHSIGQVGNFQLRRRLAHGFSAGANYTLAKSMDNASSLGAGGAVVAQNDQDLNAEWALSNFDVRHTIALDATWELPLGAGRKWFNNGGFWAAVAGEWSATMTFNAHTGSPFTPRVVNATSSVANGTSGSLRADLTGAPIAVSDPSLGQFFNTGAFSVPAVGLFGTAPRNIIIGPGGHVTNLSFSRDMRVGSNRAVTLQINAVNLFNTIQWTAIDTNINSRTFGQVTRVAPMRTITINLRFRF